MKTTKEQKHALRDRVMLALQNSKRGSLDQRGLAWLLGSKEDLHTGGIRGLTLKQAEKIFDRGLVVIDSQYSYPAWIVALDAERAQREVLRLSRTKHRAYIMDKIRDLLNYSGASREELIRLMTIARSI